MSNQVHILNGDSLLKIFPKSILGSKIVMRECMAQGPVGDANLEQFYKRRVVFIKDAYKI